MREVKFRIWDKAKGKFTDFENVGGYFLLDNNGHPTYFAKTQVAHAKSWYKDSERGRVYVLDGVIHEPQREDSMFVVQFYTGLHDKNNVEIYEGDIVKVSLDGKELTLSVEFRVYDDGEQHNRFNHIGWCCVSGKKDDMDDLPLHDIINHWNGVLLGNIYENKDLLK